MSPLSPVPIEDLRRRVREAEALLGVARGLARDELHHPARCERARDRIVSILKEIDALFPGLNDPPSALDPKELIAPSMRDQPSATTAALSDEAGADPEPDVDEDDTDDEDETEAHDETDETVGGDEEQGEDDDEEWELDRKKLAAAIENDQLMSRIPEVDRDWFKRMARRTIEAQERVELCDRVRRAFDELAEAMRVGLDETTRLLSVALTFEQLKARQRQ